MTAPPPFAWVALVSVALVGCHADGQRADASASAVTVLRGVRVIDGTGRVPLEDATLVIAKGTIVTVGSRATVKIPSGATVLDMPGKTVLPGLISDHSHVGIVDGTKAGDGNDTRENVARQLRQYAAYGVTTVMSLGLNGAHFAEQANEAHDAKSRGADLFGADRGIGVPSGAPPVPLAADRVYRPTTAAEARADVRETAGRHPTLVKLWVDDFHGTVPAKMDAEVYGAIIDEAHKQGLRVAAHVYYLDDAKKLVAGGVDVLAHGIRDLPVDQELIEAMKKRRTWYVPTLDLDESSFIYAESPPWTTKPFFRHALQPALAAELDDPAWKDSALSKRKKVDEDKESLAMNLQNIKVLNDAGIRVGFGTDSGATPLRIPGFAEHRELALLVRAGLPPIEAIKCATSSAAELLGLTDRGAILPGKRADLLIIDGNPAAAIEDIDKIESVWRAGEKIAGYVVEHTP